VYVGHIGIALALRAERGAPPLWLLVVAAQGPDWEEALLDAAGYRWFDPARSPHAFTWLGVSALGIALVAALLARRMRRGGFGAARAAALGALAYLSHWIADCATGIKPTWPGGPMVGLELYRSPGADLALETALVGAGWWLWRRTIPAHGTSRAGLAWALLAVLLALQLAADLQMQSGAWLT
jgi:hypothetical protein